MRELVRGKNTIGLTAAVLKSPIKRPFFLPVGFKMLRMVNILKGSS